MQPIVSATLQFPTIVFTILIALLALYWLLVLLRIAPLELFERDSLRDDHMASTLVSLGFAGVPATLALTFLVLIAGSLSLATELLALRWISLGMLRVPVGVLVVWLSFAIASPVAALICHSLHRGLHRYQPFTRRCLLGATVIVSSREGEEFARAVIDNEPNSHVRLHCKEGDCPQEGERRVLVKYLAQEGTYRSVSEQKYLDTRVRINRLRLRHKHHHAGYSA
ncbi:hypothetical protein [Vreelandella populi]|uniref:Uncharacterized protein n=1 Tax=Vreelandella populi TaxID=2498858 RepID=A0A3S0WJF9_9GAMM|nr:hypothetical protein [Halomonas populi]RUR39129.1 hypothetical protein ELY25_05650 [Halomonas populi]RUR46244.1 hypothetical protein ELY37_09655 [Halomonas populi]